MFSVYDTTCHVVMFCDVLTVLDLSATHRTLREHLSSDDLWIDLYRRDFRLEIDEEHASMAKKKYREAWRNKYDLVFSGFRRRTLPSHSLSSLWEGVRIGKSGWKTRETGLPPCAYVDEKKISHFKKTYPELERMDWAAYARNVNLFIEVSKSRIILQNNLPKLAVDGIAMVFFIGSNMGVRTEPARSWIGLAVALSLIGNIAGAVCFKTDDETIVCSRKSLVLSALRCAVSSLWSCCRVLVYPRLITDTLPFLFKLLIFAEDYSWVGAALLALAWYRFFTSFNPLGKSILSATMSLLVIRVFTSSAFVTLPLRTVFSLLMAGITLDSHSIHAKDKVAGLIIAYLAWQYIGVYNISVFLVVNTVVWVYLSALLSRPHSCDFNEIAFTAILHVAPNLCGEVYGFGWGCLVVVVLRGVCALLNHYRFGTLRLL